MKKGKHDIRKPQITATQKRQEPQQCFPEKGKLLRRLRRFLSPRWLILEFGSAIGVLIAFYALYSSSKPTFASVSSEGNPSLISTFEITNVGTFPITQVIVGCYQVSAIYSVNEYTEAFGGVTMIGKHIIPEILPNNHGSFTCDSSFAVTHKVPGIQPPKIDLRVADMYIEARYFWLGIPQKRRSEIFKFNEYSDGTHAWVRGDSAN